MKRIFIFIFILQASFISNAQNRNSIWCFGDSSGIDFGNVNNPTPYNSTMRGRGSCTSIANSNGSLLFYAFTRATIIGNTTQVISANDSLMTNGGNIVGQGWYRELVIITDPSDSDQYYLFSVGVTNSGQEGLYYSKINMSLNGGLGEVVQKNIQLLPYQMQDGIQAIKHGNGRDWWVICHRWDIYTNEFNKFLVTPYGISGPFTQAIGDTSTGGFLNINFSKIGSKAAIVDYNGLFEIFNFDRCNGNFSADAHFSFQFYQSDFNNFWSCEISPNENLLYISQSNHYVSYLFQLDLRDSVPWNTRDTIWTQSTIYYNAGAIELAPDNKIYFSTGWYDNSHFPYPYPDSAYYPENMNLGVINSPDNLGTACDFQPYSFYLGGHRTYIGLPNNPNYEMGPDTGSVCDTLPHLGVGTNELQFHKKEKELDVYYHHDWQTAFINASGLQGKNYSLQIFDITGKQLFTEQGKLSSQYFTKDFHCNFANGIYIVSLATEKEKLTARFIIQ